MRALWRLAKYVKYFKREAMLSALMALIVSMLRFAQIPMLIPIFNGLFRGEADKKSMLLWPDKAAGYMFSLNDGLVHAVQWLYGYTFSGEEHRLALALWSNDMAIRALPAKRWLLTAIVWMLDHPSRRSSRARRHRGVGIPRASRRSCRSTWPARSTPASRGVWPPTSTTTCSASRCRLHKSGSASVTSHFTNDIEAVRFGMSFFFNKMLVEPILLSGFP